MSENYFMSDAFRNDAEESVREAITKADALGLPKAYDSTPIDIPEKPDIVRLTTAQNKAPQAAATALFKDEERSNRQKSIDYARGSVRLEGFVLNAESEALFARYVNGELTRPQLNESILEIAVATEGEQREGLLAANRIAELQEDPVPGKFDAAHLKKVHRRIFQDMPHHQPGLCRVDSPGYYKARLLEGTGKRYHVHYLSRQVEAKLEKTLSAFGGPDSLRGLDNEQFSKRMAELYGDLDHIHAFKEGNSRTLRAFTSQLARESGWKLDWNTAHADAASRDRLYIARDKEVIARHFPDLDQDRAMKTENRAEYEAYLSFIAPTRNATTLQALIQMENHDG